MICGNCQREIADHSNFCYLCGAPQHAAPAGPHFRKRLMRSAVDSKIAGVCGGIAEYFEIDSTIVRLVWVLLVLMPVPVVPAFVGYFVAWIVMPLAPMPAPVAAAPGAAPPSAAPHSTQPA
jgi:phage shock protein C